jgi:hypothetical protein
MPVETASTSPGIWQFAEFRIRREGTVITKDTKVEEIMNITGIVTFCIQRGFSLITCSDVFPETLGKLLEIKEVHDQDSLLSDLNAYVKSLEGQ